MTSPNQTIIILDPGIGFGEALETAPIVMGCASTGSTATLAAVADPATLVSTYGQGPMVEDAASILAREGGPVLVLRLPGTTAGAAGAITKIGAGPTVTVAGAAYDSYEAKVTIVTGGALGTAEFKYTLDDGYTTTETITVPAGGSYAVPNTNLTLTFPSGTYVAGDTYEFDCTAPLWSAADITAARAIIDAASITPVWGLLSGMNASASDAATAFAALSGVMTAFASAQDYARFLMSAGDDTASNVKTQFAAVEDERIAVCHGTADLVSDKPFDGWGIPRRSIAAAAALRASNALASEDLGRVASGAFKTIRAISHDERTAAVELNNSKITTMRTYKGGGFYFNNVRLKSAPGSDFNYWQHGIVMDIACRITVAAQQAMFSDNPRVLDGGLIDPRDAIAYETNVLNKLRKELTEPSNKRGEPGHVSELSYTIDRTNDVLTTETIKGKVKIRPLSYPKTIETTIGFTREAV